MGLLKALDFSGPKLVGLVSAMWDGHSCSFWPFFVRQACVFGSLRDHVTVPPVWCAKRLPKMSFCILPWVYYETIPSPTSLGDCHRVAKAAKNTFGSSHDRDVQELP